MHPVDTIKTCMQMLESSNLKFNGMYKSIGGSLFCQVPCDVLMFRSYKVYKQYFRKGLQSYNPVFVHTLAAILRDMKGGI